LNNPYCITPDGDVGLQPYAVIREAIKKEGMVALGRVILTTASGISVLTVSPSARAVGAQIG
jgi:DNA end-binding protein Ku